MIFILDIFLFVIYSFLVIVHTEKWRDMEVIKFDNNKEFSVNSYMVANGSNAILIDTGFNFEDINNYLTTHNLKLVAVFLTHGHFDHIYLAKRFQDMGAKIYIHSADSDKLFTDKNMGKDYNLPVEPLHADVLMDEGEYTIENFKVQVIHTPGHSKGSCCFLIENNLFLGDTMFEHGYGRYDLYDGSYSEIMQSLRKLFRIIKNNNYSLYYGHDY